MVLRVEIMIVYSSRSLDSATGRALVLDNQAAPDRLSGSVLLPMGCTRVEKSRMAELGRCIIYIAASRSFLREGAGKFLGT